MKKQVLSKQILSIIVVIMLFASSNSYAESENIINWSKSVVHLDMYNNTLLNMAGSEAVAKRQYISALERAEAINTDGITFTSKGFRKYIKFDDYTQMMMTQQKELIPEQMKLSLEMARDSRTVTRNTMIIGLRSYYLALYSAYDNCNLEKMKLELAERIYNQEKIKYSRDMISWLDLSEAEYNLEKAKMAYDAANRNYENMQRSYNTFIGINPDTTYDEILYDDEYSATRLKQSDYYVERALANRLDIVNVKKQIALLEMQKGIIERFPQSLNKTSARSDYEDLLLNIETQEHKLESIILQMEKEILSAYVEVAEADKNVVNMRDLLNIQKSKFISSQKLYDAGLISRNMLDQAQIGYIEFESGYKAVLFDYNTKLMKLEKAAGLGPAYQEGLG